MLKTFRVAGFAAAAAFLCSAQSAAASETTQVTQAAHIASAAPVTPVVEAPAVNVERAVLAESPALPATAAVPERIRPDRQDPVEPSAGAAEAPSGANGAASVRRSLADLVAEHSGADVPDDQFECLASAVYYESRGEPLEGQLAVAEVILNRVRSGRFRDSICDVVKQPSQFSFVRRGVIPEAPRHSAAWQRAVAIAHIALNDLHDVTGEDSLFFHATYVNPRWGRPRIARIGNHIFYR